MTGELIRKQPKRSDALSKYVWRQQLKSQLSIYTLQRIPECPEKPLNIRGFSSGACQFEAFMFLCVFVCDACVGAKTYISYFRVKSFGFSCLRSQSWPLSSVLCDEPCLHCKLPAFFHLKTVLVFVAQNREIAFIWANGTTTKHTICLQRVPLWRLPRLAERACETRGIMLSSPWQSSCAALSVIPCKDNRHTW